MKLTRYLVLLVFILVWLAGTSTYFYKLADQSGLVNDSYRYGDLYRLSNLSSFKEARETCEKHTSVTNYEQKKPVHLFIIGDSFTEKERVDKDNFNAEKYHYMHWSQVLHFKPDTSATTIIILETVERHFREKFTDGPVNNFQLDSAIFNSTTSFPAVYKLDDLFRASQTEGRLDQLLFQNSISLKFKELKAKFNYKVFNRTNKEITMVNNGKNMVYYMDTNVPNMTSSFTYLADSTVKLMVKHLNESRQMLLDMGFDHVILSVIPNKVSVVDPKYGTYNQLIYRIVSSPDLELENINVLPEFQKLGSAAYLKGDSHWTCAAQNIWLDKTNQLISKIIKN